MASPPQKERKQDHQSPEQGWEDGRQTQAPSVLGNGAVLPELERLVDELIDRRWSKR